MPELVSLRSRVDQSRLGPELAATGGGLVDQPADVGLGALEAQPELPGGRAIAQPERRLLGKGPRCQFDRHGLHLGLDERSEQGVSLSQLGQRDAQKGRGLRRGLDHQGDLRDHRQASERADQQSREVVAGGILDDAPTRGKYLSRPVDRGQPEKIVANRAEAEPPRAAEVGRHGAADGGAGGLGNVDRQALVLFAEQPAELAERHSRADRHGQVARGVVGKPVEPGERKAEAGRLGRRRRPGVAPPIG